MKTLITLLALCFGLQAQAQSFKNLNALRTMAEMAQELESQAQFLNQMVSTEGDRDEEGTCYALGTLASSRARLQNNTRNVGSYSQQMSSYLAQITTKANALAGLCSEKMATHSPLIQAASSRTKLRRNEREEMSQGILKSAQAIKQIVNSALNN